MANVDVGAAFGRHFVRLPIQATAKIVVENALTADWAEVLPPDRCSFILGNSPFIGISLCTAAQTTELQAVWGRGYHGTLDYVSGWYRKAIDYGADHDIPIALVSTNSITQGERVAPLWDRFSLLATDCVRPPNVRLALRGASRRPRPCYRQRAREEPSVTDSLRVRRPGCRAGRPHCGEHQPVPGRGRVRPGPWSCDSDRAGSPRGELWQQAHRRRQPHH